MEEENKPENEVTITLRYDARKYPDKKLFLLWIDHIGEEYNFEVVENSESTPTQKYN